ncbi:unnamed protein product [marine sediment metagenome]|uniref:Uncharacterized protein n=1 Tax=marine sediment metagenome TaxID=412755 RepID=X1ND96_9ZZZZ
MSLSGWAKLIIGILFTIGFIVLCAMRIVPAEAYCAVAAGVVTYIVEEWRKEKEITRLLNLRNMKSHEKN